MRVTRTPRNMPKKRRTNDRNMAERRVESSGDRKLIVTKPTTLLKDICLKKWRKLGVVYEEIKIQGLSEKVISEFTFARQLS